MIEKISTERVRGQAITFRIFHDMWQTGCVMLLWRYIDGHRTTAL
jgi:hypothetical protein